MASLSATKQQLLQQINQSKNTQVHPFVKSMLQKLHHETYSLSERFKNLEDPLRFIHNQSIQSLVNKTQESSFKLKKQMEDVSQFSKSMFKKIIARQGNEFNFQKIQEEGKALQNSQIKDAELIKAQSICRLKKTEYSEDYFKKQTKTKQIKKMYVFDPIQPVIQYKHKIQHVRQMKRESNKIDLNYGHIKLLDKQEFVRECQNVEFYDILNSLKDNKYHLQNQDYDIQKSYAVNKLCEKIPLELIGKDCEYSPFSQVLYYDFDLSLRFWNQGKSQANGRVNESKEQKEQPMDEKIIARFEKFKKKQISINNIYDIAMGKITVDQLRFYQKLKKSQKAHLRGEGDDSIENQYAKLHKQYNRLNQIKTRMKSQKIPVKYLDSDSQTIKILEQQDFDDYFKQDFKYLLNRISKLSQIRENAMINKKYSNRIVTIKNSCQEISECLFKVLTLILKGEKFYPSQKQNQQNYAPFFTYRDLFNQQNRDQVERKLLELIYSKFNEFECEFVDGIAKNQLIALYIEQRQKNIRILDIISAQ